MLSSRMSTAAILAGGQASRFGGRPKPLLPLGNQRIIDRLLSALRTVVDDVFIVATNRDLYSACGVPVRTDILTNVGPLGGVHAALSAARSTQVLVVAGDMPFLTSSFLEYILHAGRFFDIAIPRNDQGFQPLCASYRASCVNVIEQNISARRLKVSDVLSRAKGYEVAASDIEPFDPYGTLFFNINTPADYARALTVAAYYDV